MAGDESCTGGTRELDQTPTWAVAGVCAAMILISIVLEMFLHRVGSWLLKKHKKALFEALEKVKAELMILGFISLLLTFFQRYIIKICIPAKAADTMLPCPYDAKGDKTTTTEEEHRRRLMLYEHRFLAGDSSTPPCKAGYEPIISINGLHQLHILIFFLAVLHVVNSVITMTLGRLKSRRWKEWERETSSHDYEFSNDPARFRLTHETSFVRAHISFWTRIPFFFYVGCFFRQFFRSVSKADYLTLRNGFITVHLAPRSTFDFQKYIKRSLEDDFKVVVGVSPVLWTSFVIFLLLNVSGWQALFWASLIPLIIILAVGTKLQAIMTKMALEITERHAVVQGIPLVQGSDRYFWFGRPNVGVLFLCSYITLPLYALITQMGSNLKKSIFDEQTSKALKKWHMAVKKKQGGRAGRSPTTDTLAASSPMASMVHPSSLVHPSGHTLHRFKTTGHSTRSFTYEDQEMSDLEADPPSPTSSSTTNLIARVGEHEGPQTQESVTTLTGPAGYDGDEFSFVKHTMSKGP